MKREKWTKEEIKKILIDDKKQLRKALLLLYEQNQTDKEKELGRSKGKNSVGFDARDSYILSELAEKFKHNTFITNRQWEELNSRIQKYAKQLTKIANEKLKEKRKAEMGEQLELNLEK